MSALLGSLPSISLLCSRPWSHNHSRRLCTKVASSAQRSLNKSRTPSNTAATVEKSGCLSSPSTCGLNGITKASASAVGFSLGSANSLSASGSSPASRAIWPLVRRLSLKGRYKSSSSCLVAQSAMDRRNASVSLPCSSMVLRIATRLSASSRR